MHTLPNSRLLRFPREGGPLVSERVTGLANMRALGLPIPADAQELP